MEVKISEVPNKPGVRWYTRRQYYIISGEQRNFITDCTSVTFENTGEVTAYLVTEGTEYPLKPDAVVSYNNQPDTMETTFYERIYFDTEPGKKQQVIVTREFVSATKPNRNLIS